MAARYSGRDRDIAESGRSKAQQSTMRFESNTSDRNARDSSVSYDRNSSRFTGEPTRNGGSYYDRDYYDDGGYSRNWGGGRNNNRRGYGNNDAYRGSNQRRGGHNAQPHHLRGGYAPDDTSNYVSYDESYAGSSTRSDYNRYANKASGYGPHSRSGSRSRSRTPTNRRLSRSPAPPRKRDFQQASSQRDERDRASSPAPPRKRDFLQSSSQRDEKRDRATSPAPPRKRDFRQPSSQRDEQTNGTDSVRGASNNAAQAERLANSKRDRSDEQEQNLDRESKRSRVVGPPTTVSRDEAAQDFNKEQFKMDTVVDVTGAVDETAPTGLEDNANNAPAAEEPKLDDDARIALARKKREERRKRLAAMSGDDTSIASPLSAFASRPMTADSASPASLLPPGTAPASVPPSSKSASPAVLAYSKSQSPALLPPSDASPAEVASPMPAPEATTPREMGGSNTHPLTNLHANVEEPKQTILPSIEALDNQANGLPPKPHLVVVEDEDDMFGDNFVTRGELPEVIQEKIDTLEDEGKYYKMTVNEVIRGRYVAKERLGHGSYAEVWRAYDKQRNTMVALKIFRKDDFIRTRAKEELHSFQRVAEADRDGTNGHMIRLFDDFFYLEHKCFILESMDMNLDAYIKLYGLKGVSEKTHKVLALPTIRKLSKTMFLCLQFLRAKKFVHGDIKPENILVDVSKKDIKIGDLGTLHPRFHSHLDENLNAGTPIFQAPEVHLDIPHDYAVDTWAIGLILFEIFTGKKLITVEVSHSAWVLQKIQEVRGPIGRVLLNDTPFDKKALYYIGSGASLKFRNPTTGEPETFSGANQHFVRNATRAEFKTLAKHDDYPKTTPEELDDFIALVDSCLTIDPKKRIKPEEALAHAFYKGVHA